MVTRLACHQPQKQWIQNVVGGCLVQVPFKPVGLNLKQVAWHSSWQTTDKQGRAGQGKAGHLQAEAKAGPEHQSCH